MERHYFVRNFNLEILTKKLLGYFEQEFANYSPRKSWFALSPDKKTLLLVVMMESKDDSGFKYGILDLLSLEKSIDDKILKNTLRLELPLMGKPITMEGKYSFCRLQGWSLEIGLLEQEEPCQTVEEAQKFLEAYAFCEDIYSFINAYAWEKEKPLPKKCMVDGREVFYIEINNMVLVVENKCHELYPGQSFSR